MKASDHQYIDPNPESETLLTYQEYEGEVPFDLTPFIDQEFTQGLGLKIYFINSFFYET
jgi:hypothetical protein